MLTTLIPAAGRSVRMGRQKLLLSLHGRTIIEHVIDAARSVGRVVVVIRPGEPELVEIVRRAGADVVRLAHDTPDMKATVLAGLDAIEPSRPEGFFLVPADHPVLAPDVFRVVADADRRSILIPTHAGRRGHPAWIPWAHVSGLRNLPADQGLNSYLRTQPVIEIPWPTGDVLLDLDTPDDFANLLERRRVVRFPRSGEPIDNPIERPVSVLPGSFNPVHSAHWSLAATASEILGNETSFEMSRENVDKPELTDAEVVRRVSQFSAQADVWVTRAARFVMKASLFPGATFVVGADTAARLVDVRYYDGKDASMAAALDAIAGRGCRFLTAARLCGGELRTLGDLAIPPRWRGLFAEIPVSRFRLDISSTELRRAAET